MNVLLRKLKPQNCQLCFHSTLCVVTIEEANIIGRSGEPTETCTQKFCFTDLLHGLLFRISSSINMCSFIFFFFKRSPQQLVTIKRPWDKSSSRVACDGNFHEYKDRVWEKTNDIPCVSATKCLWKYGTYSQ